MVSPLVIDNFFPDFDRVLAHAKTSEYYDWTGPDGQTYKRVSLTRVPTLGESLQRAVGYIEILGSAYRLNFNGELPNNLIHTDLGWGTHALVVYLNAPGSGTAFWRHKKSGLIELVNLAQDENLSTVAPDWDNPDAWEQIDFVEAKPNRAVIYKSSWFHSRFPFEAGGTSEDDGRLAVVSFFNFR